MACNSNGPSFAQVVINNKTLPIVAECRGESILCTARNYFNFPIAVQMQVPAELSEQMAAELRKIEAPTKITPQNLEEVARLESVLETALAAVREFKARL
ncbi:MAG: hypothetical protein ABSD52_08930 [Candidatus Cybelea sp.]|jgi:hypothetical protein